MSHSEAVLLQQLLNYANYGSKSKSMNSGVTDDVLGFLNAIKVAFQYNMEKYDEFLKVLRDFSVKRIYISRVKAKLKTLFKRHQYLILEFNSFIPKQHRIALDRSYALGFLKALQLAIPNDYGDFLKLVKDYKDQTIDISSFYARAMVLLKNHPDLILEFNTFMPEKHLIKTTTGIKVNENENGQLGQLPWDVLDIICKTLDFDDLFSFSGVCQNWRTFHKSNFLSSQEPLLLHICSNPNHMDAYSFISIPNLKVYDLKMMSCFHHPNITHIRVSSGYFIMASKNNSFVLFNPFSRKKMVINATFRVNHKVFGHYEALLAFEKSSEEFVLVVLCKESNSLYVYQSRYYGWFTYSTLKPKEVVIDFVVLNNIIYVVTNNANIGVLNLNFGNIQFLNLKNTPDENKDVPDDIRSKYPSKKSFKLVNCDEQLLVFDLRSWTQRKVYKIDFSTMNFSKMKTLGDMALFYVSNRNIRALSNPQRFGYKRNYVYEVNSAFKCVMHDWNGFYRTKIYPYQRSYGDFDFFDWCFRHVKYQVDYSLVE